MNMGKWMVLAGLLLCACSDESAGQNSLQQDWVEKGAVRFAVLGDAGEGNESQYQVADAMASVCGQQGCDFALYLGDNFYDVGVEHIDDEQFESKFEQPYSGLDFPFYVVLGNHDYGLLGNEWSQPSPQVEYTDRSTKWVLPDRYYSHVHQHVTLYGLDSNAIMWDTEWGGADEQLRCLGEARNGSTTSWNIAYAHHPYISNGSHGNAGAYEGIEGIPVISGDTMKDFVEEGVCGEMDVFFAGHDHQLEWLEPTCGTEFIVSGAGSKTRSMVDRGAPSLFVYDETPGFLWVEIVDDVLIGVFYDQDGVALYEREVVRMANASE